MADKRCENGHFIDESWDLCPYCPADHSDPEIPIVRPTRLSDEKPQQGPRAVPAPQPPAAAPESARSGSAAPLTAARRESGFVAPPMERTVAVQVQKLDPAAAQKRYTVAWLVGLNGSLRGESFPVRIGRNILGRDRRSDIVINDDQASSHHADLVFRPEERRFILMDHNSTNGTYVNDQEIEPRRDLAVHDVVRIGSHRMLFVPLCHEGMFWDDEGELK